MKTEMLVALRSFAAALCLVVPIGCGGGGSDDGAGELEEPAECVDVSGTWFVSESVRFDCDEFLDPFVPGSASGTGTIQLRQDGCRVAYSVPDLGVDRNGVVGVDFIEMSGPMALVQGVEVVDNRLTIEGELDESDLSSFSAFGSGRLSVRFDGQTGSCSATSTATFRR